MRTRLSAKGYDAADYYAIRAAREEHIPLTRESTLPISAARGGGRRVQTPSAFTAQ